MTTGGVVVRVDEPSPVLHQVGAEQEVLARLEPTPELVEELRPVGGREVADRATEERNESMAAVVGDEREVAVEVTHHCVHRCHRVRLGDRVAGGAQRGRAAVERHETSEPARVAQRVEQQAGLGRRARPELDERVGTARRGDLAGVVFEDLAFAPRRVVLGETRDLVEQL